MKTFIFFFLFSLVTINAQTIIIDSKNNNTQEVFNSIGKSIYDINFLIKSNSIDSTLNQILNNSKNNLQVCIYINNKENTKIINGNFILYNAIKHNTYNNRIYKIPVISEILNTFLVNSKTNSDDAILTVDRQYEIVLYFNSKIIFSSIFYCK